MSEPAGSSATRFDAEVVRLEAYLHTAGIDSAHTLLNQLTKAAHSAVMDAGAAERYSAVVSIIARCGHGTLRVGNNDATIAECVRIRKLLFPSDTRLHLRYRIQHCLTTTSKALSDALGLADEQLGKYVDALGYPHDFSIRVEAIRDSIWRLVSMDEFRNCAEFCELHDRWTDIYTELGTFETFVAGGLRLRALMNPIEICATDTMGQIERVLSLSRDETLETWVPGPTVRAAEQAAGVLAELEDIAIHVFNEVRPLAGGERWAGAFYRLWVPDQPTHRSEVG